MHHTATPSNSAQLGIDGENDVFEKHKAFTVIQSVELTADDVLVFIKATSLEGVAGRV